MEQRDFDGGWSNLYHFPPMCIGTPYVESLTSYIMRLAEEHQVIPGSLFKDILIPILNNQLREKNLTQRESFSHMIRLNKGSKFSNYMVQILEGLTLNTDLKYLTIAPLRELFSIDNVIEEKQRWCPICFEEWRIGGKTIYEPLIWSFSGVSKCPIHNIALQSLCPRCGKKQRPITFSSRVGYCTHCYAWLGMGEDVPRNEMCIYKDNQWTTYLLELMGSVRRLDPKKDKKTLINNLLEVSSEEGSIKSLSNKVGNKVGLTTLYDWISSPSLPNLNIFLDLCCSMGVNPQDLLFTNKVTPKFQKTQRQVRHAKKDVDIKRCEIVLSSVLKEESIPSLRELSNKIGCSVGYLRTHYAELINLIVFTRKQQKTKKLEISRSNLCNKVRDVMIELHNDGYYPSGDRVERRMGKTHLLFQHGVRDTWLQVLAELGY